MTQDETREMSVDEHAQEAVEWLEVAQRRADVGMPKEDVRLAVSIAQVHALLALRGGALAGPCGPADAEDGGR